MVEKPFYFLTLVAASPDAAVFCRQESGALLAIRMQVYCPVATKSSTDVETIPIRS